MGCGPTPGLGLQFALESFDPLHRARFLRGCVPTAHHIQFVTRLPQGKRGVANSDPRDGAVDWYDEYPGVWRSIVGRCCNRLTNRRIKFRDDYVSLEMRNRRIRVDIRLGLQVGGVPNSVFLRL